MARRKVLIISYHFPPVGGVKIQRMVKLIKYLGEFGFEPIVLAPRWEKRHSLDEESLAEVSRFCRIYRAPILDLLRPFFALRDWLRRRRREPESGSGAAFASPRTLPRRLIAFLAFPDPVAMWLLPALILGYRLVKRQKIDLIFSTSPPFSAHLIALFLARLSGKPFVVDLRDLWIDNPFVQQPTRVHHWLGRKLERTVLVHCAHIVCATPPLRKILTRSYEEQIARKVTVITNGYDPADFSGPLPPGKEGFLIVHGGSVLLASGRNHQPLSEGMVKAAARDNDFRQSSRLIYFGAMDGANLATLRTIKNDPGNLASIEYLGAISHKQAIETIRQATLLVFLGGCEIDSNRNLVTAVTETHSIAAKLFEYLACEKPLLLIAGACPTVELARECGVAHWCSSYDADKIADYLLTLFRRYYDEGDRVEANRELIARYSRRVQAQQFAQVFAAALQCTV
ncbi:MAG: glycosyltransferase [candidate division Zixibacteria bacterium]|nr:glycosyltransferase [candidate division Zixibacteria bacterium]